MRYYVDEHISLQIGKIGLRLGVYVTSSQECGNNGRPDEFQLQYAADNGYCIVTFNHKDFFGLAERWRDEGRTHAGILLLTPSLPPLARNSAAIARALKHYDDTHPDMPPGFLDWLHPAPGE